MNSLSFKTKFGWISAFENNNKIVQVKFGKYSSKSVTKNLKKVKSLKMTKIAKMTNFLENGCKCSENGRKCCQV